jgi:hypothetical protein
VHQFLQANSYQLQAIFMLRHYYGSDTYRRNRAVLKLIHQYQEKYPDGAVGFFDCAEDGALANLSSFAANRGLFAKTSLALVYNPGDGEKPLIKFLKSIAEEPSVTVVVVADKKLPKDFSFLYEKTVGPTGNDFEPLTGLDFLKFLKADTLDRGLQVSDAQLKAIGEAYEGDLWGAVTEVARVAFGGAVTERARQFDFIGLIRTMTGGSRTDQKLKALALLLEYDDAAKVFNMAAAFAGGAGKVRMADYDIAIKSGKLEYAEALLDYALTG